MPMSIHSEVSWPHMPCLGSPIVVLGLLRPCFVLTWECYGFQAQLKFNSSEIILGLIEFRCIHSLLFVFLPFELNSYSNPRFGSTFVSWAHGLNRAARLFFIFYFLNKLTKKVPKKKRQKKSQPTSPNELTCVKILSSTLFNS